MNPRFLACSLLALATLLVCTTARADDPVSGPYNPELVDLRLLEAPYDSGFVPANSILQLKLTAATYGDLDIDMEGEAVYDWSEDALSLEGGTNTGGAEYAIGAEISVTVRIDLVVMLEFELPGLPFVFEVPSGDLYDPYLLPGNPTRPAQMDTNIGPFEVASVPLDLMVGNVNVVGEFKLEAQVDLVGATYEATRVDVATEMGGAAAATVDSYLEPTTLELVEPEPEGTVSIFPTHYGVAGVEASIHFLPSLTITNPIMLQIAPDLEFDLPLLDGAEVVLPEVEVELPAPPRPPDPSDEGGETEESGSAEDEGANDEGSMEDSGGDTTGANAEGTLDDGCNCTAPGAGRGGAPAAAFALLALLGLRRRRS